MLTHKNVNNYKKELLPKTCLKIIIPGNMLSASLKKLGTAPGNLRQKGQRSTSERHSTQIHVLPLLQSGHILTEITTRIL